MPKPLLKAFFLCTANSGVAYYRLWQFKEAMNRMKLASVAMPWWNSGQLHAQEWQWHVHDDPRVYARTGVINQLVRQSDVVVTQFLHSWEALALIEAVKACHPKIPFLMEIDDLLIDTPVYNDAFDQYRPGQPLREIAIEQMKMSDAIVTSTPYLKERFSEFCKHIYVMPNCLDFKMWDKIENVAPAGPLRIGWAGGGNHYEDLKTIEKPIKDYLATAKNAEFHIVHGAPQFFKDQSRIVWHREWKPIAKYAKHLARMGFAIGLAPLVDNAFNRGKSNLRKLEYAGLKIPVLAAKVGHFVETCKHGRDGFLYETDEEFLKYLDLLLKNETLRRDMGKYNYLDVRERFNVESVARDYMDMLLECKNRGQIVKIDVSDPKEKTKKWITPQPVLS